MIEVSERAKEELKKILTANVDNPEAGLRLTASSSGELGLGIDVEVAGDQVVGHEGTKVLMVEENLATNLSGFIIDVEETSEGPRLAIMRVRQD